MKFITIIGSRSTPKDVLKKMENIIFKANQYADITVRSGGADGADNTVTEFSKNKHIYIPWNGFNGLKHNGVTVFSFDSLPQTTKDFCYKEAEKAHPAWEKCSQGAKLLHQRNILQIYGHQNIKSKRVYCWTKNGKAVGGTATAIRTAEKLGIEVVNLYNEK